MVMSLIESLTRIKNAVYGREVREGIHDGVFRANQIADGADAKANQTQIRQDAVEDQFDAVQRAATENADWGGEIVIAAGGRPTLAQRLDEFDDNLSHLGVYITALGADNTGTTDIGPILQNLTNGETYLFPPGDYLIDGYTVINGLDNVTFRFSDGSKITDSFGVEVVLSGGGVAHVPNGIKFENCKNLKFERLPIFNPREAQGEIIEEDRFKRKPNIDFVDCPNLQLDCVIDGLTGSWTRFDYDLGAFDMMASSFIRAYHCDNIKLTGELLDDSGAGEIFSFFQCRNADVRELKHQQTDGKQTFWSLGKFIQCENLNIENIVDVRSLSTGSLFDVSGSNLRFKNIKPDYPNGLPFDVTHEWGLDSGPSTNVIMDEMILNGRGAYETNPSVGVTTSYLKQVDEQCEIESVHLSNSVLDMNGGMAFMNDRTSNVYLKNVEIYNCVRFNHSQTLSDRTAARLRNVYADRVFLKSDSGTNHMDANGYFEMNNSKIDIDSGNLHLIDRYAQQYLSTLVSSPYDMLFSNTTFENATLHFNANVKFVNCVFKNCRFLTNNNVTNRPTITFVNSNIDINLDGVVSNKSLFDLARGLNKLIFDNTKITGEYENEVGYTLFTNYVEGEIEFINGSYVNVERFSNGVSRPQQLSVAFSLPNGRRSKVIVDNSTIRGVLAILTTGSGSGETIIKVKNSSLAKRIGDSDVEFPIRAIDGGNYDKVYLSVTSSTFSDADMTTTKNRITTGGGNVKDEYNSFSDVGRS